MILNKYKSDHFFFRPADDLEKRCNAPKDKQGVFIVYVAGGRIDFVYIGCAAPNPPTLNNTELPTPNFNFCHITHYKVALI